MKGNHYLLSLTTILLSALISSCERLGTGKSSGTAELVITFVNGSELLTKAYTNLPDTSEFLLTVAASSGNIIYKGKYGDCPESLEVSPGSYNVRVVSAEFATPAFDAPQFGDEQCVVVPDKGVGRVKLICRQMNSGIRLNISSAFLTECPDAVLFIKSDDGKLMYSYSERRTAYFLPGPVSLLMNSGGLDKILMVRQLKEREMLTVNVSVPLSDVSGSYGMSVSVDTSRVWINDDYIIGTENAGNDFSDALSVAEARESVGKEDVWVCGYVVGGDLTSASASFEAPFESSTNILLGPRSSTRDRSVCLSVQLPSGEVRDALNLVDNPSLLGKRICVKGKIVNAYYGIPGMKNTVEYQYL